MQAEGAPIDVTVHCNLVGIDKGNISRYEAQVECMRVETAIKFAIALSCTLDQLFTYNTSAGED